MKRRYLRMLFSIAMIVFAFLVQTTNADPSPSNSARSILTLKIDCASRLSGGEKSDCKISVETHDDEIEIKLTSTNPSLVKFDVNELTLLPKQTSAKVNLAVSPTPVKTTVVVKASLSTDNLIQAESSMEVVPALIASARLTASSFVGTHGAKTICSVRLRAPAPPGGIQLYLSPLKTSPALLTSRDPLSLQVPNPTIPAGKDGIDFDIPYDGLYQGYDPISRIGVSDFDGQSRTVELVVALDPQGTKGGWVTVPGTANKVTFEVVPLRVSSIAVQPSTLNGGEGLATFTLSAPPGNSEKVYLRPIKTSNSKLWSVPLGVSCAAPPPPTVSIEANELQLVQGTSTYQFKVCSTTVSTTVTGTASVLLRSDRFDAPVTVQP